MSESERSNENRPRQEPVTSGDFTYSIAAQLDKQRKNPQYVTIPDRENMVPESRSEPSVQGGPSGSDDPTNNTPADNEDAP